MPSSLTEGRVLAAFAGFGVWWGSWGAVLPAVQRSAGVDDGELGLALLCVGLGALVSMRLTGALVDRIGGLVLPATMVLLALAGIGPALVEGTGALVVSMLALGAMSGAVDVALNAEASLAEELTGRRLMNLAHASFSLGVIGGSVATGVMRAVDLGAVGVLVAIGASVVAVAAHTLRARPPLGHYARQATVSLRPWWRPHGYLVLVGTLLGLAFLVEGAWQTWSAVHLERDLGTSDGVAAAGPAVFGATAATGRLLAHRFSRIGHERQVVIAGALVAAAGTVLGAAAPVTPLALVGIGLAGLGTAACAPSLFGLAGRFPDEARGAAMGVVTTLGYLGFALAPALVGPLADVTNLPWALGSVALVAVGLALGASRLGVEQRGGVGPGPLDRRQARGGAAADPAGDRAH